MAVKKPSGATGVSKAAARDTAVWFYNVPVTCSDFHAAPRPPAELLSPAGDWESLRAAVANGADAVYFGLTDFSARQRAANFTLEELPGVMAYLHGHNVRGYVACNTLIFSEELPRVAEILAALARHRVDAVIAQDLGLVRLARRLAPGLAIHGSTQMTLTEPQGIAWVQRLGVERVILARELSLEEIRTINTVSPLPTEVFVHGALCVAYSGQCLTSESIGGRSANRGQCAQACRLPYELLVDGEARDLGDKAYLLSPQDLAAHDLIGELVRAGVASLKIEGRLKSAQYVAAATSTYRAALDAALAGQPFGPDPRQLHDLTQSFSRGFAPGFLRGADHQQLVRGRFPKSRGILLGIVVGRADHGLTVQLDQALSSIAPVKPGDGLVFDEGHPEQDEQGGRVVAVRTKMGRSRLVEIDFDPGAIQPQAVALGALVWKTDDPAVRRRLAQTYARDQIVRRRPIDALLDLDEHGRLRVIFSTEDGSLRATAQSPSSLPPAQKHPLTLALAREQLSRLGDTPFALRKVALQSRGHPVERLSVMAPKSLLNELRRRAAGQLLALQEQSRRIDIVEPGALDRLRHEIVARFAPVAASDERPHLHVLARDMAQLQAVLKWNSQFHQQHPHDWPIHLSSLIADFEDLRKYRQAIALANEQGQRLTVATLRIAKPGEQGLLKMLADLEPAAILVRNLAGLAYFTREYPNLPLVGDYSLNVTNELAAALFLEAGLARLTPGHDLNWAQLQAMLARIDPGRFELVLHQHMPLFHMEHCVFAHALSNGRDHRDCGRPCDRHRVHLRDRTGRDHPLIADAGCRNTLYNGQAQSAVRYIPQALRAGLRHFRVELLTQSAEEIEPLLRSYVEVLSGKQPPPRAPSRLRVLQVMGVTPGTLAHA